MTEDKPAIPEANELAEHLRQLRGRLGEFRGRL